MLRLRKRKHAPELETEAPKTPSPRPDSKTPMSLQRTLDDPATQHLLKRKNSEQAMPQNSIIALQSVIGNSGVQQLLQKRSMSDDASPLAMIQRRLSITSSDLSGKAAKKGLKKLKDNSTLSTFRAVQDALDDYYKIDPKSLHAQRKQLDTIIERSRKWLDDKSHQGPKDAQKRTSLEKLVKESQTELLRLRIANNLGVPLNYADSFDEHTLQEFEMVLSALDGGDGNTAMVIFDAIKSKLGPSAELVKSTIKRNHMHLFNAELAKVMDNPKFKVSSAGGSAAAIQLIKDQAQAKLDRLTAMLADEAAAIAELKTQGAKPEAQRKKQEDFPILTSGTPEEKELTRLKQEKAQFEGIVSGEAVKAKQAQREYKAFSDLELYGLMSYTSNLYGAINTPLRKDIGDTNKFTAAHEELTGSITSALHKLKPYKGVVYRHGGDFPGYAAKNAVNEIVTDNAPLSTAVSQDGASSGGEQHEVLEILTSVTGRDISGVSVFGKKEAEVLFTPGTRFKVQAVFERNGAFLTKPFDRAQWLIKDQQDNSHFEKAMSALQNDPRKNEIKRVVFKIDVSS